MKICLTACFLLLPLLASARLETRIYAFENTPPQQVEAEIRRWVPEGPRVIMNEELNQVMVVADAEIHAQIAAMLQRMDRPTARIRFWMRHNRDMQEAELLDGSVATLPVSQNPPLNVVTAARRLLPPGRESLPVVGTVFHAHISLLRESPPSVRLRLTPVVLFGITHPYDVVSYDEFATDLMMSGEEILDIPRSLTNNEFFRVFLQDQPQPERPTRPVALLLSLQEVHFRAAASDRPAAGRE